MTGKERWVFIVNPVAGNGHSLSLVGTIRELSDKYGINAETVFTEKRGHGSELSRSYASKGFKYIIAVGGDGTFNEVASPLVNNTDVVTGELPGGTANGVSELAGFPEKFDLKAWETFFRAETVLADVGQCNGEIYFFTGLGIGFDVEVAHSFNRLREADPAKQHSYLPLILKMILFYREKRMTVVSDGMTYNTDCFMHTVSSGARTYARAFRLTPDAIANDGLLDVCSIEKLSVIQRLGILMSVPKGKHLGNKKVSYYRSPQLSIGFGEDVPFHADGEIFHASRLNLNTVAGGVRIIYNPCGPHHFNNSVNSPGS